MAADPVFRSVRLQRISAVSALAIAVALATPAHAQSLQGSGVFAGGSGSISTTATTTDISVDTPTAVINWTPSDTAGTGTIAFQPAGTTATFHGNLTSGADFAVLNRVIPVDGQGNLVLTRPIQFDGHVVSQLQSVSGAPTQGGTVFFYSPGGIIVGATAVFDVGNLALTTSDLNYNASTGAFDSNGSYAFLTSHVGAAIQIDSGAQINASVGSTSNAYVALVAPTIVNNGAINVDGSAALIAAEAATVQFSPDGLFTIQVDSGTSATGTVLTNNGTVTGANPGSTAVHAIYMVAVPKNTAITMAIAGGNQLGFDVAGAANVVGNTVVLSAGYDVVAGAVQGTRSAGGGTGQADLRIGAVNATSAVIGQATGEALLRVTGGATANFASNLALAGVTNPLNTDTRAAHVVVQGAGSSVQVGGSLVVTALDAGAVDGSLASDSTAAQVDVTTGGSLSVTGNMRVDASRFGLGDGGSATGGSAALVAGVGATVDIGGNLDLVATGAGAPVQASAGTSAGSGTGGDAQLAYGNGASVAVHGNLTVDASGVGGVPLATGYAGGNGSGGSASVLGQTGGGALNVFGSATLHADGVGRIGQGCVTCTFDGGAGKGGTVTFALGGTTAFTASVGGGLTATANAVGGEGQINGGGNADGGSVSITAAGGAHTLTVTGATQLQATAAAGVANSSTGGFGHGGTLLVSAANAAQMTFGAVGLDARASGGDFFGGGVSGAALGGDARMTIGTGGGTLSAGAVTMTVSALGGMAADSFSGPGGAANGGTASLDAAAGILSVTSAALDATARGGGGIQLGGAATGGDATIASTGGAVHVPQGANLDVYAAGGYGDTGGGAATGGTGIIAAGNGNVDFGGSSLVRINATGTGGDSSRTGGATGVGAGGLVQLTANHGDLSMAGTVQLIADGAGGVADSGANGGAGAGGQVQIDAQSNAAGSSHIFLGQATVSAVGRGSAGGNAFSGTPDNGGAGGLGTGGNVVVNASATNGHVSAASFTVDASGLGGTGGAATLDDGGNGTLAGIGGDGHGGSVTFDSSGVLSGLPATGQTTFGNLTVMAVGTGAVGGAAGGAVSGTPGSSGGAGSGGGGSISILAEQGGSYFNVGGTTTLSAYGTGANGTGCTACLRDAGSGAGGAILIGSTTTTTGNALIFGTLIADAGGFGGNAQTTDGGAGQGGSVHITGSGVAVTADSISLYASAEGGNALAANTGGAATGGDALIELGTAAILAGATLSLDAGALAGSNNDASGRGGVAMGGAAILSSIGGAIHLTGDISLTASATGGAGDYISANGVGGNAMGGIVVVRAGIATAIGNGGAIQIDGATGLEANAQGGSGGTTGTGQGGSTFVSARDGSIIGQALTLSATGTGGAGVFVGNGGAGLGGSAQIVAQSATEGASTVTFGTTQVVANGAGGLGGTPYPGLSGAGNGGAGTGGDVLILGAAGNGMLTLGDVSVEARGLGGAGGDGSSALSVGNGGDGATGGLATGGVVEIGMESGLDTGTVNTGSAQFGAVSVFADARGGDGGAGGSGPASGNGGAGGDAVGGGAVLLVRGGPVALTSAAQFHANAQGGFGGNGTLVGAGGNASVGIFGTGLTGANLVVTNRFGQPAQRGLLTATGLSFQAQAVGGAGATIGGQSDTGSSLSFQLTNADISATSIDFITSGTAVPGATASLVALQGGAVTLSGDFSFTTPNALSVSLGNATLSADHVLISAGNWIDPGTGPLPAGVIAGTTSVTLQTGQDLFAYSGFASGGNLQLLANGAIGLQDVSALGSLFGSAGTSMSLGAVTAGGQVVLTAPGDVTTAAVSAGTAAILSSGGLLTTGAVLAGDVARLFGSTGVIAGDVMAGNAVVLGSPGTISAGLLSAGLVNPSSDPFATYDVTVQADGAIQIGGAQALGAVKVFGGQTIDSGAISGTDVAILSAGNQTLGGIAATGRVLLADATMSSLGGDALSSGYNLDAVYAAAPVATAGTITLGGPVLGARFVAATTARFTAQAIQSAGIVQIAAGGAVTTGDLQAAGLAGGTAVRVQSGLGITLGAVTADAGDIVVNAGRAIQTGALAATAGGVSLTALTGLSSGTVLASGNVQLQAGEGSLDVLGVQSGGTLTASAVGDARIGRSVVSQAIDVQSGGLVTVAAQWQAPSITIQSQDIAILAQPVASQFPAGLNAGVSGTIRLVSIGQGPMLIGDGLTGTGYALDNGEWSRINSGSLRLEADSMQIGTLDVTGPDAGSTIDDPNGSVAFVTGATGSIRVTGRLVATGFRSTNTLAFQTGTFELDADTGALAVMGTGTIPQGNLRIAADHIHVASGALLDKLSQTPFYTGVANDLAMPTASARGVVIQAGAFEMRVGQTFYIQNTGSRVVPAGFLVPLGAFGVTPTGQNPVTMIVNGGFLSSAGTLSGRFAFDAFKRATSDLTGFASASSLNGCLLTATTCGPQPDPDPDLKGQIDILQGPGLGDTPSLPGIDEEDGPVGDEGTTGPIAPPAPLFDTRPLEPQGDIDEPVAGSGNPGLTGTGSNPQGEPK